MHRVWSLPAARLLVGLPNRRFQMQLVPLRLRHRNRAFVSPTYGARLNASRAVAQITAEREQTWKVIRCQQARLSA